MAIIGREGKVSAKKFAAEFIADMFQDTLLNDFQPCAADMTEREREAILDQFTKYTARIAKLLREKIELGSDCEIPDNPIFENVKPKLADEFDRNFTPTALGQE